MATIKEVIAKVAKKETLNDEEHALLASFDPDRVGDDKAAAARRKSEEKAAELEKKLADLATAKAELEATLENTGKTKQSDLDKARKEIADLAKSVTTLQGQIAKSEGEKVALVRNQTLAQIRAKAGIQFASGLDAGMLEKSFAAAFDGVEDLNDDNVVKIKTQTWAAMNTAAIVDTTGHGSGGPARVGNDPAAAARKGIEDMSPEQRQADLKKKGML